MSEMKSLDLAHTPPHVHAICYIYKQERARGVLQHHQRHYNTLTLTVLTYSSSNESGSAEKVNKSSKKRPYFCRFLKATNPRLDPM